MVTVEDVRAVLGGLPRSDEVVVRGRLKYRVRKIVYVAFSRDETIVEFAFPKTWRNVLVESRPETFVMPRASDLRYDWIGARMASLELDEMRDLVLDAWRMVVPKRVAADYDARAAGSVTGRP